jgi:hypothetical protein
MSEPDDIPATILKAIRSLTLTLPEVHEDPAWTGTRWRVGRRTFAHVLRIESGWPPAYARAAGTEGPALVLMFRSSGLELDLLRQAGDPWFAPVWRADEVGLILGRGDPAVVDVDWSEVGQLLTDSYCLQAPKKHAASVRRPPG